MIHTLHVHAYVHCPHHSVQCIMITKLRSVTPSTTVHIDLVSTSTSTYIVHAYHYKYKYTKYVNISWYTVHVLHTSYTWTNSISSCGPTHSSYLYILVAKQLPTSVYICIVCYHTNNVHVLTKSSPTLAGVNCSVLYSLKALKTYNTSVCTTFIHQQ